MTSGIGPVGTLTNAAVAQAAPVTAAAATQAPVMTVANDATTNANTNEAPLTSKVASPNQKIVFDPQAGLIDQYLNNVGSITVQVPSAVVVAYLHAGLTAAGLPKPAVAGASA